MVPYDAAFAHLDAATELVADLFVGLLGMALQTSEAPATVPEDDVNTPA